MSPKEEKFPILAIVWFLFKWYITIMLFVTQPIPTLIATIILLIVLGHKREKLKRAAAAQSEAQR